jgi:outer membrane receptor protein involved in Fe transport
MLAATALLTTAWRDRGKPVQHRVSVASAAALVVVAAACSAHAQSQGAQSQGAQSGQSAPPPATAPSKAAPGKTVEGVTVTGASQNGFRSSIDRRSYGVANDLATTTGAITDALKNIPSVEVDVQGNVSLRGDSNVTILIDGKPSSLFKGATAAQALQAMSADSIERVEVITNPSAEFSPEGSAGIINLITKKVRRPGRSGSVRLNVGTGGRASGGATAAYNSNKLTLTADISGRRDGQDGNGDDVRTTLDGRDHVLSSSDIQFHQHGFAEQGSARVAADYDLTDATRLSGELRYFHFDVDVDNNQPFIGRDGTGAVTTRLDQQLHFAIKHGTESAQATVRHKFGEDHELVVNVSRERTDEVLKDDVEQLTTLPVEPDLFTDLHSKSTLSLSQAKADYTRPMADGAKLKAGYDLRVDRNDYDNVSLLGTEPGDARANPAQTNLFRYRQTVNAAYVTYEQPFGDWTVLGGLRLEEVQLDLDQVTTNLVHDTSYFKAYPSLHLAYRASDDQQLTLSYSERVQRPNPQDLNPFRLERDPLNFQAGNPNLQPQITHSFEAAYQYKAGQTFYLGTLYYRQNEHGVTDVVTDLGGGQLLTTRENLSQSKAAGLELVANGHISKALSYNVSTNLYWTEIDATGQGLDQLVDFAGRRSAFEVGGRASLTWQATPNDNFQVNGQLNAKRLTPQGFNDANFISFLGYRHKFNDSLSAVVTAQDLFGTLKFRRVIDTPTLRDINGGKPTLQAVFVGFTWNFGAANKRPRDPGFDFGGAAPQP